MAVSTLGDIASRLRAELFMTLGGLCFGTMDTFAKLVVDVHQLPAVLAVFCRMLVTTLLTGFVMQYMTVEHPWSGPPDARGLLVLRGLTGGLGVVCNYSSLRWLQLGEMLSIWFTVPIMTALLASCILNETSSWHVYLAGACSAVGTIMVTQPQFRSTTLVNVDNGSDSSAGGRMIGSLLAFLGTFLGALQFVIIRKIGSSVHVLHNVYYYGLVTTPLALFLMMVHSEERPNLERVDGAVLLYLIGLSAFGALAVYFQNAAIQMQKAGRITLYLYVQLPYILFLSWIVFHDVMDWLALLGCLVIVASAVGITMSKKDGREAEQRPNEAAYDTLRDEDELGAASVQMTPSSNTGDINDRA